MKIIQAILHQVLSPQQLPRSQASSATPSSITLDQGSPPSSDDHLSFKFLFPQSIQNFQFLLNIAGHPHRCRPLDWKRIWANRFKFQRNAHIVLAYEQTVTRRETSPPHFLCHLMQYRRKKDIFGAKTAIHVVGLVLRPVRPVQDTTPITLPVQFVHTPLDNWSQKSKKQIR